ncbi:hypothetical protein AHF37_03760 [Paragonimus kellicotti]|nr:hypothetical protein AHF37_03760 [Paragonimus kellicotti]
MRSKSKEQKAVTRNRLHDSRRKKNVIFGETSQQHTDTDLSITSHFKVVCWRSDQHKYKHIGQGHQFPRATALYPPIS